MNAVVFKNIDFHNVSSLTEDSDGSYIMHRFPYRLRSGFLAVPSRTELPRALS